MSSRPAADAGALLIGRALAMVAEAGMMLLVVRLLGKADVGVLAGMLVVCQTIAIVATAGVPASLLMMLPGEMIAVRFASARAHLRLLHRLGLLSGIVLAIYGIALGPSQGSMWLWLAPFPLFDLPMRALPNLLVIEGRAGAGARLAVIKSVVASAATLVPVAAHAPLWVVAASASAGAALVWVAVPVAMASLYRDVEPTTATVSERVLLWRSLPLGITDIAGAIAQRFDRLLVLAYFSPEVFAEYQVGAWQIPFVVNIPYVVGTACAAPMRELFASERGAEAVALWRASIHQVALVVVPISVVFLVAAEAVVELLFTAAYLGAVPVFICYTLLTMMRVAAFGVVLVAARRPRDLLVAASLGLLVSVVLAVVAVFWLGPIGPAVAAVVAYVPAAAFYCRRIADAAGIAVRRTFPIRTYLRICACAAVPGLLAGWTITQFTFTVAAELAVVASIVLVGFATLSTAVGDLGAVQWQYLSTWFRLSPITRR